MFVFCYAGISWLHEVCSMHVNLVMIWYSRSCHPDGLEEEGGSERLSTSQGFSDLHPTVNSRFLELEGI